jgi:hypothetical protein
MPYIDFDVDIDDFLSACNSREIKELIQALIDDGHLPESISEFNTSNIGISESEYEDALGKLHGKYHTLSKEEEEAIIKISKRF